MTAKQKKIYRQLIHNRLDDILSLIKGGTDPLRIERDTALLTLDILDSLKTMSLKEGCGCFRRIDYALDQKTRNRFSEDFVDLLNEGVLLDETGAAHGPDLNLVLRLARDILERDELNKKSRIKSLMSLMARQRLKSKQTI